MQATAAMQARRVWRVHAMHVKLLSNLDSSPYDHIFIKRNMAGEFFRQMRAAAISWLSRPFGGDRLCGELVLLQLLCKNSGFCSGRVFRRMTLNIFSHQWRSDSPDKKVCTTGESWGRMEDSVASDASSLCGTMSCIADSVAAATAAVYPYVTVLPVTDAVRRPGHCISFAAFTLALSMDIVLCLQTCTCVCPFVQTVAHRRLFPYHDASANRLRTGMLQQAPHACVIMDECVQPLLSAPVGHDARRTRNLQSLQSFLANGVLEAEYAWQQVQLPVSGSALALSTQPSTFASACHVSICVAEAKDNESSASPSPLQGMRSYLASAWDLWPGISYTPGGSGDGAQPSPAWVQQKLVARGKSVGNVLNGLSSANGDTVRAFEATVLLLHCLTVSHGRSHVSEDEWVLLEALVERVALRNRSMLVPSVQATGDLVQLPDDKVGNRRLAGHRSADQIQPATSAGEAVIAMLRESGRIS